MAVIPLGFIALLLLGVPIAYILGGTTIIYLLLDNQSIMFNSTPQRMFSGLLNYSLLAIPMFVFVGELMNSGGITKRLIDFSKVILGHFRGGLAYVNVLANMFLASILGSANAQTAMMSKVMIPAMEKEGYKRDFSGAVTVSSALMGPIIPPSLTFILYAVVAETSVSAMFLGGIIPGILLAIGFGLLIYFLALKEELPKSDKSNFKQVVSSFLAVIPALLVPTIILVGILSGAFTATESSAVAALIALIVGKFFYRELEWKKIPEMLEKTAINSAIVTFMIAMAYIFGWVLTHERIPQTIGDFLISMTESPIVFLLLLNVLFFFIGMVMEGIAALIILTPVLLPAAVNFGIDPVHFGIIICINLTIGLITPPVGTALFIASSIGEIKMEKLARTLIPFICVAVFVLFIITYIPATTQWLPGLFN
ncbi:TRAP transporter large permease [Bacillus sp. Marseille-P3661]|uniref:TRAP transporter large permease n=1 Tax=Bacillus sp. Marseille-P3661 TaxID=1936234 RepID=UPI000C83F035|nr:TRAP transporter large permease [Bacillus sp. Marseille-P3661]